MKHLFLAATVMMSALAGAQTVHIDTRQGGRYVELDNATTLSYLTAAPKVDRLYVKFTGFDLNGKATFYYWLKYPVVVDGSTVNYTTIKEGPLSMWTQVDMTISDLTSGVFDYIADSTELKISYK